MNHLRFSQLFACLLVLAVLTLPDPARAAEHRAFEDIRMEEFAADTQVSPDGTPPSHVSLAWWIPHEYWQVAIAVQGAGEAAKGDPMLDRLREVSLLAVVQAEIGLFGSFQFYDEAKVRSGMKIALVTAGGRRVLTPVEQVDPALVPLLGMLKPMLSAAMGNLGTNMHFFVLDDRTAGGGRVVDPYAESTLEVELHTTGGTRMVGRIETPVNALFVPRKCANGKPAHVSWRFCPWDGKPLD